MRPSSSKQKDGDVSVAPSVDHRLLLSTATANTPRLFSSDAANNYYNAMTARHLLGKPPLNPKPPRTPTSKGKSPRKPKSALKSTSVDGKSVVSMGKSVASAASKRSFGSRISWKKGLSPNPSKDDDNDNTSEEGRAESPEAASNDREAGGEDRQQPSPPREVVPIDASGTCAVSAITANTRDTKINGNRSGPDASNIQLDDDPGTPVASNKASLKQVLPLTRVSKQIKRSGSDALDAFYEDETSDDIGNAQKLSIASEGSAFVSGPVKSSKAEASSPSKVARVGSTRSAHSIVTEIVPKKNSNAKENDHVPMGLLADMEAAKAEKEKETIGISYDPSNHVLNIHRTPIRDTSDDDSVKSNRSNSSGRSGRLSEKLKNKFRASKSLADSPMSIQSLANFPVSTQSIDSDEAMVLPPRSPPRLERLVLPDQIAPNSGVKKTSSKDSSEPSSGSSKSTISSEGLLAMLRRSRKMKELADANESAIAKAIDKKNKGNVDIVVSCDASSDGSTEVELRSLAETGADKANNVDTNKKSHKGLMKKVSARLSVASSSSSSEVSQKYNAKGVANKSLPQLLAEALALSQDPDYIALYLIEHGGDAAVHEFIAEADNLQEEGGKSVTPKRVECDNLSTASSVTFEKREIKASETMRNIDKVRHRPTVTEVAKKGKDEGDDKSIVTEVVKKEKGNAAPFTTPKKRKKKKKPVKKLDLVDDAMLASQLNRAVFDSDVDKQPGVADASTGSSTNSVVTEEYSGQKEGALQRNRIDARASEDVIGAGFGISDIDTSPNAMCNPGDAIEEVIADMNDFASDLKIGLQNSLANFLCVCRDVERVAKEGLETLVDDVDKPRVVTSSMSLEERVKTVEELLGDPDSDDIPSEEQIAEVRTLLSSKEANPPAVKEDQEEKENADVDDSSVMSWSDLEREKSRLKEALACSCPP